MLLASKWLSQTPTEKVRPGTGKQGKTGQFLISPAPCLLPAAHLSCPDYLSLLQVCRLVLAFMALLDDYLSTSVMSLEKSACCPLRCCSISSKYSRKLWHTVFIVSISWTVHCEQLERAGKRGLSEALREFTAVAAAFPPGLTCVQCSPAANVLGREQEKPRPAFSGN